MEELMEHRISHQSYATDARGHGSWCYNYELVKSWWSYAHKKYKDVMHHFIESRPLVIGRRCCCGK